MKANRLHRPILLLVSAILLPTLATASEGMGRRQGPPPEAIEACEGKKVGDSVDFTGRRGKTVKATCQEIEGQLVAFPDGTRKGEGRPR